MNKASKGFGVRVDRMVNTLTVKGWLLEQTDDDVQVTARPSDRAIGGRVMPCPRGEID